jgi:hypothetical protein
MTRDVGINTRIKNYVIFYHRIYLTSYDSVHIYVPCKRRRKNNPNRFIYTIFSYLITLSMQVTQITHHRMVGWMVNN